MVNTGNNMIMRTVPAICVMLRGINRQDIFEDDEDYRQMTGCLRSLTERYDEMITSPHDP